MLHQKSVTETLREKLGGEGGATTHAACMGSRWEKQSKQGCLRPVFHYLWELRWNKNVDKNEYSLTASSEAARAAGVRDAPDPQCKETRAQQRWTTRSRQGRWDTGYKRGAPAVSRGSSLEELSKLLVALLVLNINSLNRVRGHRTGSIQPLWSGRIPQGKNTSKPKVVHAYITAEALYASAKKSVKKKK